ncbi:hypothetical protein FB192DRAFT_1286358, partial [Mucor lusitanicus]
LSPSKWKTFWSLRIPLNARSTWNRVLHDKITTRELLQDRLKDPSHPFCPICKSSTETIEHFLFSCPIKPAFWTTAFRLYMPPSINQNSYSNFRKFLLLEQPIYCQQHTLFPSLSVPQIFACMLQQTVWYFHYQHHFHRTPFLPNILLSHLRKLLLTLDSEEHLDQIL